MRCIYLRENREQQWKSRFEIYRICRAAASSESALTWLPQAGSKPDTKESPLKKLSPLLLCVTFDVCLQAATPALTVTCPLGSAQVGVAYNSLLVATGGAPPYTFSITGSLPPGLGLSAATGAVTGTPTGLGTTPFIANVQDSALLTATSACTIVTVATPPSIPTLSPWGLGLLTLLLAGCSVRFMRRAPDSSG